MDYDAIYADTRPYVFKCLRNDGVPLRDIDDAIASGWMFALQWRSFEKCAHLEPPKRTLLRCCRWARHRRYARDKKYVQYVDPLSNVWSYAEDRGETSKSLDEVGFWGITHDKDPFESELPVGWEQRAHKGWQSIRIRLGGGDFRGARALYPNASLERAHFALSLKRLKKAYAQDSCQDPEG